MANRRQLREYAVQILYGTDFWDLDAESALDVHRHHFCEDRDDDLFLCKMIEGIVAHREAIDDLIRQFSTNWRLERMAIVDRNILRMATYELLHLTEVPRKVAINEAIEVAKKFGGDDSPSFINGILDRIALEVRGPETEEERAQGEASRNGAENGDA
jgi:N utilization substance protein B